MNTKDRELLNKGLDILSIYVKGKTIGRISAGFIAGGVSILGFNNLIPYLVVAIRPELSKEISTGSNTLACIGIIMIIIGALVPLSVTVFNHYRQLYIDDLASINSIYSLYDPDTFIYHMNRISDNTSMFDFEIDKIEELHYKILGSSFHFNDKKTNQLVKRFGNELRAFQNEMGIRLSPAPLNPHLYITPRHPATFYQIAAATRDDCNRLMVTYNEVKLQFDILTKEKMMRFFK